MSGLTRKYQSRFVEEKKMEFDALQSASGAPSARASTEVQSLNFSSNADQLQQGKARLDYKDKEGSVQNLTSQVRNIQGRAFYNNGSSWVDISVQRQKQSVRKNRVQFASPGYFTLLKQYPAASQFMSLGKNVSFVMNNEVYEIYE
jgi:hypothetical protein